jgi:hypothetical protein
MAANKLCRASGKTNEARCTGLKPQGTGEVGSHRVGIIEGEPEPEERSGARNLPAYSGRRREDDDA